MWSSVLRAISTAFFVISIKTLQQVQNFSEIDTAAKVMFLVNFSMIVFFPIFSFFFLKRNKNYLAKDNFKKSFGTLYENIQIGEK